MQFHNERLLLCLSTGLLLSLQWLRWWWRRRIRCWWFVVVVVIVRVKGVRVDTVGVGLSEGG